MTRALQAEDLFRLRFLRGAELSPDSQRAVYTISATAGDGSARTDWYQVWTTDLGTGTSRALTDELPMAAGAAWAPDGGRIAEFGGTPTQLSELYAEQSPITYASACATPTLLIQGDDDLDCTPEQSEQFFRILTDSRCETEMLRFPASSHTASLTGPPVIRAAQNEALLDWFNRYLS